MEDGLLFQKSAEGEIHNVSHRGGREGGREGF